MEHGDVVGVRELRQNLSVYLVRVAAGESLVVTDHGQPVALLSPIRQAESITDRLAREGRLIPGTGDILTPTTPRRRAPKGLAAALTRERSERRL
jgi:prevent-host-death family protein